MIDAHDYVVSEHGIGHLGLLLAWGRRHRSLAMGARLDTSTGPGGASISIARRSTRPLSCAATLVVTGRHGDFSRTLQTLSFMF